MERDTLKISDDLSFEEAALIEPMGCRLKGLRRAKMRVGNIAGGKLVTRRFPRNQVGGDVELALVGDDYASPPSVQDARDEGG